MKFKVGQNVQYIGNADDIPKNELVKIVDKFWDSDEKKYCYEISVVGMRNQYIYESELK